MRKNWKTTVLGVLTLAATGWGVYTSPEVLDNQEAMAGIVAALAAGVGLIHARDAEKKDSGSDQGAEEYDPLPDWVHD